MLIVQLYVSLFLVLLIDQDERLLHQTYATSLSKVHPYLFRYVSTSTRASNIIRTEVDILEF